MLRSFFRRVHKLLDELIHVFSLSVVLKQEPVVVDHRSRVLELLLVHQPLTEVFDPALNTLMAVEDLFILLQVLTESKDLELGCR